jgi:hypothetical protein
MDAAAVVHCTGPTIRASLAAARPKFEASIHRG